MKNNFTNEDFEKFIRQQADQLRMRPSDKVWSSISGEIHRKRRWFGLGIFLFLISTATVSSYFLIHSAKNSPSTAIAIHKADVKNNTVHTLAQGSKEVTSKPSIETIAKQAIKKQDKTAAIEKAATSTVETTDPTISLNDINNFQGTFADSYPFGTKLAKTTDHKVAETEPYSIESVINKFTAKKHKLSWQYYFTPTISYRKLTENKSYLRKVQQSNTTAPNYAELYNINDVVTHKPDIGLELGVVAKYALSKNIKIRGGLQFNMTHYDIKAFDNYVPQVATIALNAGARVDSVNTITKYRNFGGANTSWLQNFYFQISAPIGVEVLLKGDDKVQFGIATTVQPTYVLGERAYMISSDYQSYTKVPWLIRHWNVNTNLETFVSYSTGQLKWQVGPQIRYQLLSSFVNEYPVKENLFDFGLKVGIGLNK